MLFNEKLTYTPGPTLKERIAIGKVVLTNNQLAWFIAAMVLSCIILPVAIFFVTGYNFIASGIAFILADILCESAHYYFSIIAPHKSRIQEPLGMTKDRIEQWESKMTLMENQYQKQSLKSFNDLAELSALSDDIENLKTYLKYEKSWTEEKLTAHKKEELTIAQRPVKEYEEKKVFFTEFKERLEMYISLHKLDCLQVVLDSIADLISVLDKRPNGYDLIPTMFYVYIDELQKIITKINEREKEQVQIHMQDLTKVATALSQNINRMIERIYESEATEIDIGLSVLLRELNGEEGL